MAACECVTYADGARMIDTCCAARVTAAEKLEDSISHALLRLNPAIWKSYKPSEVAACNPLVVKLAEVIAEWYLAGRMAKQLPPKPVEDDGC